MYTNFKKLNRTPDRGSTQWMKAFERSMMRDMAPYLHVSFCSLKRSDHTLNQFIDALDALQFPLQGGFACILMVLIPVRWRLGSVRLLYPGGLRVRRGGEKVLVVRIVLVFGHYIVSEAL